jgi:hypothetical protein
MVYLMDGLIFGGRSSLIEYDLVVAQLATRAEDLTDLYGTFVETIYPEKMQARANQIINGRRGAGKTHLLRRVEGRLCAKFAETKILPVYVNGSDLSQEINIVSSDPATVALAIYVQIMQHVAATIRTFVVDLNQAKFWDRFLAGGKSQHERSANEIAATLAEILISGQVRRLPAGEVSDESTTLLETSVNSSIGASIKLDPRTIGWAVKAGTAAEKSAKSSSVTTKRISGEIILPFAQVSYELGRLLKLLDNASLHILFDEWSDIDKDPKVQPYLAEMLRKTVKSVPGMYLKLACIPGRTFLATPITEDVRNPIGLEEGDDIHADIDLDSIIFSGESIGELVPFFMTMIKKHVGEKITWVRTATPELFESFLASFVFAGAKPFLELCHASGGVPRDFMNIYRTATTLVSNAAKSGQPRRPLDVATIRVAARSVYQSKRASFSGKSTSQQLQLLERIYQEIYVKKNSFYFLLSEEAAENATIQTLYTERLIHRVPLSFFYDPTNEQRYQYFQLDYGTAIDRLMSNAANDAYASYETSTWIKLGQVGNKFLGRVLDDEVDRQKAALEAAIIALFDAAPSRLDINRRELIFDPGNRVVAGSHASKARGRGRHRQR